MSTRPSTSIKADERVGELVKLTAIEELLRGIETDLRQAQVDVKQRLDDIQRSLDKLKADMGSIDPRAHQAELLAAYQAHTQTALNLLQKLDEREVAERTARRRMLTGVFTALWEKGGAALVLGLVILLLGLLSKYAGVPLPMLPGGSP